MNIMKDAEVRTTIEKDIQNVLRRSLGFQASGITITIYGACACLYGNVCTPELRDKAERLTRSVPGVSEVKNYLAVNLFH
jgi:osmotically-inducible protein OsmY